MGHREALKGSIGFKHPQGGKPGSYEHTTSGSGWEGHRKFVINNNTDAEWRGIPAKGSHFIIGHRAKSTAAKDIKESWNQDENSYHHGLYPPTGPGVMVGKLIGPKNIESDIKAGLITLEKIENAPVEDEFE